MFLFQVVILSLVPNEENVRELMSNASSVVDVASIRNRFIYQELFKADLSDAMTLPSDLSSFSHPYLQFLWNLFSTHPKFVKRSGNIAHFMRTMTSKKAGMIIRRRGILGWRVVGGGWYVYICIDRLQSIPSWLIFKTL